MKISLKISPVDREIIARLVAVCGGAIFAACVNDVR